MSNKVLVLNGPNLGRLGVREPEIYGSISYQQLEDRLIGLGTKLGLAVEVRQTDFEGEMIGWLHEAADLSIDVVLNAGAWTHYCLAVADAAAEVRYIEMHISNVFNREPLRANSLLSPKAVGVIAGFGVQGYEIALNYLANR